MLPGTLLVFAQMPLMPPIVLRVVVGCLVLLGMASLARGGMTSDTVYTERGKTDFDTVLQLLNPYGTWSKIDGKWAYTPSDHLAPYTDGRWLYTEYGWYWKGQLPHSWATEHYGYWKRSADKVWSWYPGPYWLPNIVEIRATPKYLGWRSGEVDDDGNFVEAPIDRYSKPDEWVFVTREQFANPITPDIIAKPDVAESELDASTDCNHNYHTYREIQRPGPHPADLAGFSKDGGMLAPLTMAEQAAAMQPKPKPIATNTTGAAMTGTTQPAVLDAGIDPNADTRQVKYWVTMSLPTFWTKPPADAKIGEIYIYRPDTYQDEDGIARRIAFWFNPKERATLKEVFQSASSSTNEETAPAVPAPAHDPFQSPFDESYHPSTSGAPTNAPVKAIVPPGTNAPPLAPN